MVIAEIIVLALSQVYLCTYVYTHIEKVMEREVEGGREKEGME